MKTILFYESGKPNSEGKVGGSYYSLYELVNALHLSYKCVVLFKHTNVTCSWYEGLENVEVITQNFVAKDPLRISNTRNGLVKPWLTKNWYRELSALKTFFFSKSTLPKDLESFSIDVIINNNRITENLDLLLGQMRTGAKIIQYQRAYESYYPLFLRWMGLNTITVSNDIRYKLPPSVRNKSTTVYNWLSTSSHLPKTSFKIRKPMRLVWLGRGVAWKGLDILEEIIFKSIEFNLHLDIYIISDVNDSYNRLLRRFSEFNPKNVRLFINRKQQDIELREYDCLLHTSVLPEPFGRVIIEAMSAGLIPITTGIGGSSEILNHGVNGFITNSESPKDFITMLTYVMSLPTHQLNKISEKSYYNWKNNFSGRNLKQIFDVIEK